MTTASTQYEAAKQRAAGILYVRNRMAGELVRARQHVARVHDEMAAALSRGDEARTRAMATEKAARLEDVLRAERELAEVQRDADDAKTRLVELCDAVRAADRRRVRAIANRLAVEGAAERELDALLRAVP